MTPCAGDTIRLTRGGPLRRVTRVVAETPGEWDSQDLRSMRERRALLQIDCYLIDPITGDTSQKRAITRLEQAPNGNLRSWNDYPPDHWAHIGEVIVVERPALTQPSLF